MAAQGVRVSKVHVQLNGAREELEGCLMLLLEGVAVADHAPRLRREQRLLQSIVREIAELDLLLEVPETRGVVLETFESERLRLQDLLVSFLSVLILGHFEVAASNLGEDPTCLVLLLRKLPKDGHRLLAAVEAELQEGMPDDLQEAHHIRHLEREAWLDQVLESYLRHLRGDYWLLRQDLFRDITFAFAD